MFIKTVRNWKIILFFFFFFLFSLHFLKHKTGFKKTFSLPSFLSWKIQGKCVWSNYKMIKIQGKWRSNGWEIGNMGAGNKGHKSPEGSQLQEKQKQNKAQD